MPVLYKEDRITYSETKDSNASISFSSYNKRNCSPAFYHILIMAIGSRKMEILFNEKHSQNFNILSLRTINGIGHTNYQIRNINDD